MPGPLDDLLEDLTGRSARGDTTRRKRRSALPTEPRSFQDTLSAILGRDVNTPELPTLAGLSGVTTPLAPNTIFLDSDFAGDDPASRFTQGHELGHLVDFADAVPGEEEIKRGLGEGGEEERERNVGRRFLRRLQKSIGIVREDPLVSEQFADEFEKALSSLTRGEEPESETERRLQDFIRRRIAEFERRQAERARVRPDASRVRPSTTGPR